MAALLAAALLVSGSNTQTGNAAGAIRLKLSYTLNATLSGAKVAVADELDFLMKGNEVEVYHVSNGAQTLIGKRSASSGDYFGHAIFSTKVSKGNLVLSGKYATHTVSATVNTDGHSTCSATVDFHRLAGHSFFEIDYPGMGNVTLIDLDASGISCMLSTE